MYTGTAYSVKRLQRHHAAHGCVYDLFSGKTSLKVSLGRYLEAATNGVSHTTRQPATSISRTATRNWTDSNRLRHRCDLLSTVAQDNARAAATLRRFADDFQDNTVTTVQDLDLAAVGASGLATGISPLLAAGDHPRASVESASRQWFQGFSVTDNPRSRRGGYDPCM